MKLNKFLNEIRLRGTDFKKSKSKIDELLIDIEKSIDSVWALTEQHIEDFNNADVKDIGRIHKATGDFEKAFFKYSAQVNLIVK